MYRDPRYHNVLQRPASVVAWNPFQLVENLKAVDHGSEHCVLAVEMVMCPIRDEELARVRVLAAVCHGKHPPLAVFEGRHDLILEFAPIYANSPFSGALGVAALNHKPLYVSVELGIIVDARGSQPEKVATWSGGQWTSERGELHDRLGASGRRGVGASGRRDAGTDRFGGYPRSSAPP